MSESRECKALPMPSASRLRCCFAKRMALQVQGENSGSEELDTVDTSFENLDVNVP